MSLAAKMCFAKVRYATRDEAQVAQPSQRAYRCLICEGYHSTTKRKKGRRG